MSALTIVETTVTAAVSTATRSQVLRLNPGWNRVTFASSGWSGGKTAALKFSPVPDSDELCVAEDVNGPIEATANKSVDMMGPGFICFDLTSPDSNGVTMRIIQLGI